MRIVKIYETILNVSAVEMYSNLDLIIMDKLRAKYEGFCEKGSLIMTVKDIIKRSKCKLATDRLDGSGTVNVQFTAEAIIYPSDSIIVGCEVQKVERNNRIICKYEHAVVNLKGNKNLQTLRPGQLITVKVINSSYILGQKKVTINALPYSYGNTFTIYFTDLGAVQAYEDIEILIKKIEEIDEEYKLYEVGNNKVMKKIQEIHYPYKKNYTNKMSLPKGITIDSLYDMAKKLIAAADKTKKAAEKTEKAIGLARHPIIDKISADTLTVDPSVLEKGIENFDLLDKEIYQINTVTERAAIVLLRLLEDYLQYIRMIREMSETYNTEKMLENHNNIWSIYDRNKQ